MSADAYSSGWSAGARNTNALRWSADIPVRFVDVGGMRLRYIATGTGPTLVLLHTLRTQLDIFERMVPELATHFSVYALDYPDAQSWQDAQKDYPAIDKAVLLIWGDRDWSRPSERARTAALIPDVKVATVAGGGHFLSLDQPDALNRLIVDFAGA
jgi:pimeloyl-ACP methyl ester carboxylesterase